MSEDEQKARAIINDYIHTVTGMKPEDRFFRYLNSEWKKVSDVVKTALDEFMEAFGPHTRTDNPKEKSNE